MNIIKTAIIPHKQTFVKVKNQPHELDYKAICVFTALGFFLDNDTYWLDTKVLRPATINTIDDDGFLMKSEKWFKWHYTPRDISLELAVSEFTSLFENIIKEQTTGKQVILPLSGGLDSRTQAVALHNLKSNVISYSYSFENGYKESNISRKVAVVFDIPFKEFTISKGYLWKEINRLAGINNCYSEFTHPRQMAVIDEIGKHGDLFSLGHWGDVLFDSDEIDELDDKEVLLTLKKKIIKKGGLELAEALWKNWNIDGEFVNYLNDRLLSLWNTIEIDNNSAKMRAFKSLFWAPRWTSINLSIFENAQPISLPYYDDRMCEFICTLPDKLLANRQLQINYIKNSNSAAAKVVWQDARPFNLYTHHLHKLPYTIPYRLIKKIQRTVNGILGKKHIQRNWELQFLGKQNQKELEDFIFNKNFNEFYIPKSLVSDFYTKFKSNDSVYYSHSLSMILTLSMFYKRELGNEHS